MGQNDGPDSAGDGARAATGQSDVCADDGRVQLDAYAHARINPFADAVRREKGGGRASN